MKFIKACFKNRTVKIELLLCIGLFIFMSCKKDVDEDSPKILLSSPIENANFTVGEFIGITGKVTDNFGIEYVKISLLDANFISVLDGSTFYPNKKEFFINYSFEINNLHLLSGNYYINIRASDGKNDKNVFVKINLFEVPLELKKIFTINSNGIDSISNSNSFPVYTFLNDYKNAIVNQYNNQLVFCGEFSGDLIALNGQTTSQDWMVENEGVFGSAYFTILANDVKNNRYTVGLSTGFVNTYNQYGTMVSQFSIHQNFIAENIFFAGDKILVQEAPIGSGNKNLSIYFNGGSLNGSQVINGDILEVSKLDEENYFVFVQETDKLRIYILNISDNTLSFYYDAFPDGEVKDVEVIDDYTFFLSHQDRIYRYTYGGSGLTIFKEGPNYNLLVFEKVGNVLYSSNGNNIEIFDPYSNGNLLGTINSGEIEKLLFLYNR
jgi:hypothetical protein